MDSGFTFAVKNAMCTETNASYSYTATKGTCKDSCCTVDIAQGSVTGSKAVSTDSEHVLTSTVAQHSVPITLEADQSSFQSHLSIVLSISTVQVCDVDRKSRRTQASKGGRVRGEVSADRHKIPLLSVYIHVQHLSITVHA